MANDTYNEDWCPTSKSNKHYYQPIETKTTFEEYDPGYDRDGLPKLYEKVEYTYMYCNCASVKKVRL